MFQLCGGISSEPLNPQKCNWAHFIAHALRISTTPVTSSYLKRGLRYSRNKTFPPLRHYLFRAKRQQEAISLKTHFDRRHVECSRLLSF